MVSITAFVFSDSAERIAVAASAGDGMPAWPTNTLAAAALLISVFAAWTGLSVAKRQARELSWTILSDLTTGEVAAARNRVGTFMYGTVDVAGLSEETMVRDYYTLVWCVERVGSGHQALSGPVARSAVDDFRKSVTWHTQEIAANLSLLHLVFSDYNDNDAWDAFMRSAEILGYQEEPADLMMEEVKRRGLLEKRAALAKTLAGESKRRRWF